MLRLPPVAIIDAVSDARPSFPFGSSIEPVLKRIKENNIKILGEGPVKAGSNDFILIQDPDGLFIELISRP